VELLHPKTNSGVNICNISCDVLFTVLLSLLFVIAGADGRERRGERYSSVGVTRMA
jgi:hypothetical protein